MSFSRWLPVATTLVILLTPAARAAQPPHKIPDLTINMVDGKPVTLSQYKGHPVVLVFILTTCSHCQNAVKILSKLQVEYRPRGLQVVASAVEQDSKDHLRLFVKNFAPPFPVGYNTGAEADTVIHPTGKMPMMPLLGLIDRQGLLRSQYEGEEPFFNDLEQNLRKEIELLLGPKR